MSFQQGLSGLSAASRNLDVIGNNVSNANTIGYKTSRAQFADMYANSVAGSGMGAAGIGVRVASVSQQFSQGNITTTNNPLDIAINGEGFFRLSQGGTASYTRNGQFQLDKDGYVVSSSGGRLQGYAPDASGRVGQGTPGDLRISRADLPPKVPSTGSLNINLDSRKPTLDPTKFKITDASTYQGATSMNVYDSLGNPHTLSTYYVKSANNEWKVFAANDGAQLGTAPLATLTFKNDGTLDTTATTLPIAVSVPLTNGANTPLAFNLDLTGSTQFGSAFTVNELTQDGYAAGKLTGFAIGPDGTILGRYSNGQSLAQGQVAIANFVNAQGLVALGNNQWGESPTSGQPLVGAPGTGTLGALQAGALEEANVDLTAELVNMITAQRTYQANAKTISAQDEVMQTIINMR